ncbi:MFS transporter [Fluviispira multicolorata]|uniref:MFS transporter n=1 Tax=Fluviispira multicolorata TaxID=2654512 RepID=A0A833JBN5_9BACT|nr:MFS transporter [Fluviispira multicolorata]KAB8028602.1 MFS transporter [Fluviispira multicolorata]
MSSIGKQFYFVPFLIVFEFCAYMSVDMIMPGMLFVVNDFSVSHTYVPSALSLFILGGACVPLFLGPLADRYGRKKLLILGVFIFIVSCILNSFSISIFQFLLTRFLQGTSTGFIGVIGYAAIQELFEEKKAVKIQSLMTTIALISPILGPFVGSIYLEYFNWRYMSSVIGTTALISLIGLLKYMPNDKLSKQKKNKVKCQNLFSLAFSNYLSVLKNKTFMAGVAAFGFIEIPLYNWVAVSPLILIKKENLSEIEYSLYQIPVFACYVLGILLLQKLLDHFSLKKIIILGSTIAITGIILGFIFPIFINDYFLYVIIVNSIYAFGGGMISAPLYRLTLFSVEGVSLGYITAIKTVLFLGMLSIGSLFLSFIYKDLNNIYLGIYGLVLGILYLLSICYFFKNSSNEELK